MARSLPLLAASGLILLLAGCASQKVELARPLSCHEMVTTRGPDNRAAASVDPTGCLFLDAAKKDFHNGDYGSAERNYRRAIEFFTAGRGGQSDNYVEALLGLAASYDSMKRFDLADQIYATLGKIAPNSAEYNNNYGYSLLLRGERERAKSFLARARQLAPANSVIQNNAELLQGA